MFTPGVAAWAAAGASDEAGEQEGQDEETCAPVDGRPLRGLPLAAAGGPWTHAR